MNQASPQDILSEQVAIQSGTTEELLTVYIDGQEFGISIFQVQDVLRPQTVTPIPLSSPEVEGALNLRGRIVTAIDVRKCLRLLSHDNHKKMSVVVEHQGELFSLLIDKVGDVLKLNKKKFDRVPTTLDAKWRDVALGIYRLENNLLIVLDVPKLLDFDKQK